jgi:hypothetical protein
MALTPESLTEQQMQPFARETHSETEVLSWETVICFSMSVESPNSVDTPGIRNVLVVAWGGHVGWESTSRSG